MVAMVVVCCVTCSGSYYDMCTSPEHVSKIEIVCYEILVLGYLSNCRALLIPRTVLEIAFDL